MLWALPGTLVCLTAAAFLLKDRSGVMIGGVLLGNWIVNTVIVYVSGVALPWPLFMAVDYISAVALLNPHTRLTKCQIGVALLYAIELIGHSAYGLSDHKPWPQYRYYYLLLYTAWAQSLLLGGGIGIGSLRRHMRSSRGSGNLQHIRSRAYGMGEKRGGADQ